MKINYNSEAKEYTIKANKGEIEIIQNALCITMSGRHIPAELKEERGMTADMEVMIDKALTEN